MFLEGGAGDRSTQTARDVTDGGGLKELHAQHQYQVSNLLMARSQLVAWGGRPSMFPRASSTAGASERTRIARADRRADVTVTLHNQSEG